MCRVCALLLTLLGLACAVDCGQFERPSLRLGETRDPNLRTYFSLKEHIEEVNRQLDRVNRLEGQTDSPRCDASRTRRRKEAGDISQKKWDQYAQAVIALKNSVDQQGLDAFEQFAAFHKEWQFEAHDSEKFLPWHRWFLYFYETALQQYNRKVTIPYWNWARDARNPRSSLIFTASRTGSARDGQVLWDGPFRGWWSSVPEDHYVTRWLESTIFIENERTIDSLIYSSQSTCNFMSELELIHGFVHNFIGGDGITAGDMTFVNISANDPIFYNHQYVRIGASSVFSCGKSDAPILS